MTRLHVSMSFSARLSLVHFVAWNPTSTEFQPQLLTDLSRLSNGCSLYVWCLVCPRSHSALPLCLHFHRPFAHIRSSFRRTFFMDSSSLLCLPPLLKPHPFAIPSRHQDRIWQSNTPYHISITLCTIFHNIRNLKSFSCRVAENSRSPLQPLDVILSTGAFFDPKMERQYDLQLSNCRSPIHHSAIFAYSPRHSMQELDFHIIIHFVIFYPERWAVLHSIFFRTLRLPLITQHKHATIHQLTNFLGTPASKKPSYHGQCRCQCRYHHAYQNSLFLLSLDHFAYIMHVCLIIQDKYCKLPV